MRGGNNAQLSAITVAGQWRICTAFPYIRWFRLYIPGLWEVKEREKQGGTICAAQIYV